jgi:hypothetical protein
MLLSAFGFDFKRLVGQLPFALVLGSVLLSCSAPVEQSTMASPSTQASTQVATLSATPIADYSVDALIVRREKQPNLSLQVTYPRLRPRPGTARVDTLGVQAFNREAKAFVEGLVNEIETKSHENKHEKASAALQVSFRAYMLQQGLASVAFTIGQDGIGPRPLTWATGLTYDLRTGRKVKPGDLFRQNTVFKTTVIGALQADIAGQSGCQLEPDNMAWDNFVLGPDAYYVLLGDAQIGRTCNTRAIRLPLAKLRPFAVANSVANRL